MITVICHILLSKYTPDPCPALYILPVLLDFALLGVVNG